MNPNLLYDAVRTIVSKRGQLRYTHTATFVTAVGNIAAQSVVEFYQSLDYASSFCAEVTLRVHMSVYNYRKYLYANRDNLQCVVQKLPIDPVGETILTQGPKTTSTYRAFLVDNEDPAITRGSPITSGTYVDGKDDLRFFTVQLVDTFAEYASVRQGGVNFRFTKTEDVLKSFILASAASDTGQQSIYLKGLEIYPPDVTEDTKLDQISVPHTLRLIDFPGFIQEKKGGIYNQGLGSFIVNGIWYIFPLYNTKRWAKATARAVLYQVPTNMVPIADTTYQYDGSNITIVCSGSAKIQDTSVSGLFTGGNGTRFTRASQFFAGPTTDANNQGQINRSETMAEFKTVDRDDGFNIGNFSDKPITDNLPNELSKLAIRSGQIMVTTWQNSAADLIFPGMPIRVYQDIGGKITCRDGVILQVDEQWALERPGLTGKTMVSTAGLVIFLSKEEVA